MPELPEAKREQVRRGAVSSGERASVRYAELHCKTNFSFLEGASHADELVQRAAELGYRALAITDRNSLAGIVRAHVAAKEAKLKLLVRGNFGRAMRQRSSCGAGSGWLWPIGPLAHAGTRPGGEGGVPARVRRHRGSCGGVAGGSAA